VKYGTDLDKVQSQLQTAVNRLPATFPDGVDSQVIAGSFGDFPVMQLAVSSDLSSEELAPKLTDSAVTALSRLEGVRDVTVSGARTQRFVVNIDAGKLAGKGLTSNDVSNALRVSGLRQSGGAVQDGTDTLSIEVGAPFATLDDIKNVPLPPATAGSGGAPSGTGTHDRQRTDDHQTLRRRRRVRAVRPPTGCSRVDGKPARTLAVTKKPDGNTVVPAAVPGPDRRDRHRLRRDGGDVQEPDPAAAAARVRPVRRDRRSHPARWSARGYLSARRRHRLIVAALPFTDVCT